MKGKGVWLLITLLIISVFSTTAETISLLPTPTTDDNGNAGNSYYSATYSSTLNTGETVSFTREGVTIGLQPHSLNWNNALSQLQQINMPQNVQRNRNGDIYEYQNAYGQGINLRYTNKWYGVKEEIIINSFSNLATPQQYVIDGGEVILEANFLLTTNAQHIRVDGAEWDKSSETTTTQDINIYDDNGKLLYHLPRPNAIDNNGEEINGSYTLKKSANKLYISINIPYSFLTTATYPVSIDPTFYVDYSPIPARLYDNGDQYDSNYSTFDAPTDVSVILSDGNTETRITIEKKATGDDLILRTLFNDVYEYGYEYFIRFYKRNNNPATVRIYGHINNETINTTSYVEKNLTGVGYYDVLVTNLSREMNNLSLSSLDYRIVEATAIFYPIDRIEISEVMLRKEANDTTPPQINNCYLEKINASCDENITFSCIVTDDIGIERVLFSGYLNGIPTELTFQALKNNNIYYYTFTNTGYGEKIYNWTNVTAIDLFGNEVYQEQNKVATYNCVENCTPFWIPQYINTTSCSINNTILQQKNYYDDNSCGTTVDLPLDNGTLVESYCNYCDSNWINLGTCLENNTILNNYVDYNVCYVVTGLQEDAPPVNDGVWTSCQYFNNDFECYISEEPYITDKMEYTCTLPTGNYDCINTVSYGFDDILQVNPQKKEKSDGIITLKSDIESREYFTANKGLLNAYFTSKNLVADNDFIITTICSDDNQILTSQQIISPTIKDLHNTNTWLIWGKRNIPYLFILFLLLILGAMIIGSLLKHTKGR